MDIFMQNARKIGLSHPEASAPIVALLFTAHALRIHLVHTLCPALRLTDDQLAALLVLHSQDPKLVSLTDR